jgi:signal transduction histidine kinase
MYDALRQRTDLVEPRMVAAMRLVLAASALLIIYIDPAEPDRYVEFTYATLSLYVLYSAALYGLVLARAPFTVSLPLWSHWADIGWYILLIALSSGTNSIFFIFLFFSVLVASFRWGFKLGVSSAIISALLFSVVGYLTRLPGTGFELNRFLFRPVCLLVLGYMIAYRGGFEIALQRRLVLLREISAFSNPRFGISRTLGTNMEKVRAFYGADSCSCVFVDSAGGAAELRRSKRNIPDSAIHAEILAPELAAKLLACPNEHAVLYPSGRSLSLFKRSYIYDVVTALSAKEDYKWAAEICDFLETSCFISVPWFHRNEFKGRLFVTSQRPIFGPSDITFLLQAIGQIAPVLDNIRLVDQLASTAAEEERRKIARDIHDSVVQPYIGIKIGLASVEEQLSRNAETLAGTAKDTAQLTVVAEKIHRLVEMSDIAVEDLRGFIGNLKYGGEKAGDFASAVRRFSGQLSRATGIDIRMQIEDSVMIHDRLAAEIFQMVAEGLSNIQRHTQSTRAVIRMNCREGKLFLRIENDGSGETPAPSFTPRSIMERAAALQGSTRVEHLVNGGAAVLVEIPL